MKNVPAEIQDLVDNPRELQHVELKNWIDLSNDVARAKIARHLAALCNHGGGYIVFGLQDDGAPSGNHPGDISKYDRDMIGGIIDRYLAPAFQCEVFHAARRGAAEPYAVTRVPGHGSVPVCAKRNGPHDTKKNAPQGIRQGLYYIRAPGPKSMAIETPEQWRDLIHRCVVNERESLLASISKVLRAPEPQKQEGESLTDWHRKMHAHYLELVESSRPQWPVSVKDNHYQFSYRLIGQTGVQALAAGALLEAIRQAGERVRNVVWTGWSMFHPFTREEIKPRFVIDAAGGEEVEAIETILLGQTFMAQTVPDFWRITADGRATIIRLYREDRVAMPHLEESGIGPGMWLSPETLAREVYEVATHAKELAKSFDGPTGAEFRCTWYGLKDRRIASFDRSVDWYERKCAVNERSTNTRAPLELLAANPQSIVEQLIAPVGRLFDGLEISAAQIESWRPGFKTL